MRGDEDTLKGSFVVIAREATTEQERSSDLAFANMTNALATALNALSNASRRRVDEADILPILATGDGPGHLVRALFGDCSFETLDRLGAALGVSRATVRTSYARAKRLHAAANAELDADG